MREVVSEPNQESTATNEQEVEAAGDTAAAEAGVAGETIAANGVEEHPESDDRTDSQLHPGGSGPHSVPNPQAVGHDEVPPVVPGDLYANPYSQELQPPTQATQPPQPPQPQQRQPAGRGYPPPPVDQHK